VSIYKNFIKTDPKCRRKFLVNMGWKGLLGFLKFRKRKKKGMLFPAFQFISITNDCNLKCQGCWVSTLDTKTFMHRDTIHSIIEAGKKQGSYFYGILGGEPLLYKDLVAIFSKHPDCYFQLFTNGTLFTDTLASQLRNTGNVSPLISFEGDEMVADIRRGGHQIFNRTIKAIRTATSHKLITGVAISVCKSNISMALSDAFVQQLHDMGVLYLWYYIYRPAGSNPNYDLALDEDDILRLREFLVEGRTRLPMVIIDSYWRANGEPFCPAADGLSHHINPEGYIEPCPVIQLAGDHLNGNPLEEIYEHSAFLKRFRKEINHKTNGCILMEDPAWLGDMAERLDVLNTSNRPGFLNDLKNAPRVASHGSCPVIPEKHILYRLAKKTAFFGMGAYG
jgi:MoaA/NifB/PqqE/SkfB family radical SAM enzyme